MADWFADESFWVAFDPFLFSDERLRAGPDEVAAALALAPYSGRRVLDLCCGPGRHAVALARKGFSVTGVDASEFLLGKARKRARRARVEIEWVRSDMREFARPKAFDLAISMFSSLGYFEDVRDERRVLRNLHASLAPGGALVIELAGKECVARDFQRTVSTRAPDGSLLFQRHEVVENWGRIDNEWTLVRGDAVERFRFRVRLFSACELRDLLERAGFAHVRLFGNFEGAAYDHDAKRLVAVAVKEA